MKDSKQNGSGPQTPTSPAKSQTVPNVTSPEPNGLDLESLGFFDTTAFGFDEEEMEDSNPLNWSLNKDEGGLSDWKIEISEANTDNKKVATYYVHKAIIGAGLNRSQYFVRAFQSQNNKTAKTSIILHSTACEAFPGVLNFIYSHEEKTGMRNGTVVALRYLAQFLGIKSLFVKATEFIGHELKNNLSKAAPRYLAEATLYNDTRLANSAAQACAAHMEQIDPLDFAILLPPLAKDIFALETLSGSPIHLSRVVAVYFELHEDEIDEATFREMTKEKTLPTICPSAAISLLKSLSDLPRNDPESKEWQNLQERCRRALAETWNDGKLQVEGIHIDSYTVLPEGQQVELLEACLGQASQEAEEANKKIKMLEKKVRDALGKASKRKADYETRIKMLESRLSNLSA